MGLTILTAPHLIFQYVREHVHVVILLVEHGEKVLKTIRERRRELSSTATSHTSGSGRPINGGRKWRRSRRPCSSSSAIGHRKRSALLLLVRLLLLSSAIHDGHRLPEQHRWPRKPGFIHCSCGCGENNRERGEIRTIIVVVMTWEDYRSRLREPGRSGAFEICINMACFDLPEGVNWTWAVRDRAGSSLWMFDWLLVRRDMESKHFGMRRLNEFYSSLQSTFWLSISSGTIEGKKA